MLDKKIHYIKQGDYLIPNLTLENKNNEVIGKYGRLRLKYLKSHKKALYQDLLMKNELTNHLVNIDKTVTEQVENLIEELSLKNNIDEISKETNQLKWVELMNNIKASTKEIILSEIIYD